VLYDSQDTHLSAVFFVNKTIGNDLSVILNLLVVWLRDCSIRTAANFSEQDISKQGVVVSRGQTLFPFVLGQGKRVWLPLHRNSV